ncbi:hypothetical protein B0H19DRAFT_1268774 [Mycena capillaripes]|nr:hypothetical protein B0H19DRAFT_1268774 [Mycena capillaripes]
MSWPPPETFRRFPLASAPSLQRLEIECQSLLSGDLRELLRCTPTLTELKIVGPICFFDGLFDDLRANLPTAVLVPQLEALSINAVTEVGLDFEEGRLLALIASRWETDRARGVVQLKSIVFNGMQGSKEFTDKMETYRADGLHVDMLSSLY